MKKEIIKDNITKYSILCVMLSYLLMNSTLASAQEIQENQKAEIKRTKIVSIGLRNGFTKGVTLQCEDENYILENIVFVNKKNFNQTVIIKKPIRHSSVVGLKTFAGVGLHYYHSRDNFNENPLRGQKEYNEIGYDIFGLDFIMGIAYKIPKIPMMITLDLKPDLEIFSTNKSNSRFYYEDRAGLTIRYIL
tara:strand:+ start:827 stop:1399 length:573 start_codon:yes stop_codon:yes gene_type:complete